MLDNERTEQKDHEAPNFEIMTDRQKADYWMKRACKWSIIGAKTIRDINRLHKECAQLRAMLRNPL